MESQHDEHGRLIGEIVLAVVCFAIGYYMGAR